MEWHKLVSAASLFIHHLLIEQSQLAASIQGFLSHSNLVLERSACQNREYFYMEKAVDILQQ